MLNRSSITNAEDPQTISIILESWRSWSMKRCRWELHSGRSLQRYEYSSITTTKRPSPISRPAMRSRMSGKLTVPVHSVPVYRSISLPNDSMDASYEFSTAVRNMCGFSLQNSRIRTVLPTRLRPQMAMVLIPGLENLLSISSRYFCLPTSSTQSLPSLHMSNPIFIYYN